MTTCDKHGYILDVTISPGNINGSTAFDGLYDRLILRFSEIIYFIIDCGFKTPWICKWILDDKRPRFFPTKNQCKKKDFLSI
ncbi:MAG: transposase [Ruminococcus sp.]|nr:transposase [Ruminococcus sp.]